VAVKRISKKAKIETAWYDDLCILYQRTKIPDLRNLLWEQVKNVVYARVHEFIREKKPYLRKNKELSQKLFQESFFIFIKATDIWDKKRKTKFLTFLGDILDQEILNIIRLDNYHKARDKKIEDKLRREILDEPFSFSGEEQYEKSEVLEELRILFENFNFSSQLDRDIINTIIYGKVGDWVRLQKKSDLSAGKFNRRRREVLGELRGYIEKKGTPRVRAVIKEILNER